MSSRSQAPRPTSSITGPWAIGSASSPPPGSALSIWSSPNGHRRTSRSGAGGAPCEAHSFLARRYSSARRRDNQSRRTPHDDETRRGRDERLLNPPMSLSLTADHAAIYDQSGASCEQRQSSDSPADARAAV